MPQIARVSLGLIDSGGKRASLPVYFGNATANYLTIAPLVASAFDLATDAKVETLEYTVQVALPSGVKATPTAGAYLPRAGLLTFALNGLNGSYSIDVPAAKQTEIVSGSREDTLNTANPSVFHTLITALQAGFSDGTLTEMVTNPDAFEIAAFLKSRVAPRKRGSR